VTSRYSAIRAYPYAPKETPVTHADRSLRSWLLLVVAGVALAAAACGGGSDDDDAAANEGGGGSDGGAEAALFAAKGCAECHGAEGEGTDQPNTELAGTRMIIQQFETRVRNGKGSAMPAFGEDQITDEEIDTLYEWLKNQ
jgi:mono/diheme cytochrome c family protein